MAASRLVCRLVLIPALVVCGCSGESSSTTDDPEETQRLTVAVTSCVLEQMTTTVGGDDVIVTQVIPTGQTSRAWKPDPQTIQTLQQADLILINGAGYEKWRTRVSLPGSRVVDTASGYYDQFVRIPDAVTHQHGPDGEHSHPGTVWATWLDPQLARAQLDRVVAEMTKRRPRLDGRIQENAGALRRDLDRLEQQVSRIAHESAGQSFRFVADGPYYQYLIRHFQQPLTYLHWPADAEGTLSEAEEAEFRSAVAAEGPVVFLISSECSSARLDFAEQHCQAVVSVDLMDRISDTPRTLVSRLEQNISNLASALEGMAPSQNPSEQ